MTAILTSISRDRCYTGSMKKSREKQIEDLQRTRAEIARKAAEDDKKIVDRLRPLQKAEAAAERKRRTERERLAGAWMLEAAENNIEISRAWYNDKIAGLTRKDQRELFNLEPLEDQQDSPAAAGSASGKKSMKKKSRKELIEDLKRQRKEIAAKAAEDDKRIADRQRRLQKEDAKVERRRQNRCKYVAGAWVLDAVKHNTEISLAWYHAKVAGLTRSDQRKLFNLEPLEDQQDDSANRTDDAESAVTQTPITTNQADWLRRLRDQQPELATELGVPAEDDLQNLGKTAASSFISAASERLNQMRIRLKKNP